MIPCTYRQLEIFLAAAEDCHFARTADRLGISQPAVTSHITTLEQTLGKRLFVRRRGTTPLLSRDGEAFVSQARTFLAEGEKIRAFRSTPARETRARVRVAAGAHLLEDVIRPRLSAFYRACPGVVVECVLADAMAKSFRMLERRKVDLVLFSTSRPKVPPFASEVLRPIRFGLYASPAFEAHRHVSPSELSKLPFILPPEGSEPAQAIEDGLAAIGAKPEHVAIRAQFSEVIIDLAKAGLGVAAAFETMVSGRVEAGDLIEFDLELPQRHRTLFRRDEAMSEEVAAVRDFFLEQLTV